MQDVNLERCKVRLAKLTDLPAGWDGEGSKAIDRAALRAASAFLDKRSKLSSRYRIYPTVGGGVLFEFVANSWDLSIELIPGGTVEFFGVAKDGDEALPRVAFPEVGPAFLEQFDKYVGARWETN